MSARVYAAVVIFVLIAPGSYGGKIMMMYEYVAKLILFELAGIIPCRLSFVYDRYHDIFCEYVELDHYFNENVTPRHS